MAANQFGSVDVDVVVFVVCGFHVFWGFSQLIRGLQVMKPVNVFCLPALEMSTAAEDGIHDFGVGGGLMLMLMLRPEPKLEPQSEP